MPSIAKTQLPQDALLSAYDQDGHYTDCYTITVKGEISHPDFVFAFYTTWLFKLERFVLKWLASKPSTDTEARLLANGVESSFAAWSVEGRTDNQILLRDFQGRTRSWLMTVPHINEGVRTTTLYFGSAVVPKPYPESGSSSLGFVFSALGGIHKLYSRLLLGAARRSLEKA